MPRLDQELVQRGMARSRSQAAALVADGRVLRNGVAALKAALKVSPHDQLCLVEDGREEFVSRAGRKLADALSAFSDVLPAGLKCLDAGASTGGFTDVLLRRGAASVAAVDVGHGQLVRSIRNNPRVAVHEGINVRYLDVDAVGGPFDLTVADLSFISLTVVMEALCGATSCGGSLLLMIKPQFEVGRQRLPHTGVVVNETDRQQAVTEVLASSLCNGGVPAGLVRNPIAGRDGNVEFFLWLRMPMLVQAHTIDDVEALERATRFVSESMAFGIEGQERN
ncbi:TlyA family RNA methyltransferase [Arthrobacter roseus]|uniref:TlyA family RNA methyltransferase n=1 Tax=Arthrobacter roseus TaxID=136274 RepID=UPI001964D1D0|nr:TlyA family RNA methyltransferase [Arthrobacter roseus]MBM7848281.1 23S rRNA (cytidine1920-2'-O)/16S rRNA (cytidine1409-2'-O)-methyltransferase [Arthrobacter roseus]